MAIYPHYDINYEIKNFKEQYINEVDYNFTDNKIILSSTLNPILIEIIKELTSVGIAAFEGALGAGMYDIIKDKLIHRIRAPAKTDLKPGLLYIYPGDYPNIIIIDANPKDPPVLNVGNVRPLFHIQKDFVLVLNNVKIKYVGSKNTLIKEVAGPAFSYYNVSFEKMEKAEEIKGEFNIRVPIWVGKPDLNPYAGQKTQNDPRFFMYG